MSVVPVNDVLYFRQFGIPDGTEHTSIAGLFTGIEGVIFYIYSSAEAGAYEIDIKVAGQWRNLASGSVDADDLNIVDVPFFIPEARVRFTAASFPTVLDVHAFGYPAVYSRQRDDV